MNRVCGKVGLSALLFVTIFVSASPCHSQNSVGLPLAMYALQVSAGLRIGPTDLIINVPADVATIQGAIDKVGTRGKATINVAAGTYNEKLIISMKDIKLVGVSGKDSTIIQGGGSQASDIVIQLTSDAGADISGITVRNGKVGIQLETSRMLLHESQINGNANGVRAVNNSTVGIFNSSTNNNTARGIIIGVNSMGYIDGCDSSNNRDGIWVEMTSMAWIQNSTFSNNSEYGVCLTMSSNGSLTKNQIHANPVGLNTGLTSSAFLYGGNSIYSNSSHGISINYGSSLNLTTDATGVTGSATPDNIYSNGGYGIVAYTNSSLLGTKATISSNTLGGVYMEANSAGSFSSGVSITNHSNYGVYTRMYSSFTDGGVTFSENTKGISGCSQSWGCLSGQLEPGLQGAQGPVGPKGDTGATGATGATGPQGPAGSAIGIQRAVYGTVNLTWQNNNWVWESYSGQGYSVLPGPDIRHGGPTALIQFNVQWESAPTCTVTPFQGYEYTSSLTEEISVSARWSHTDTYWGGPFTQMIVESYKTVPSWGWHTTTLGGFWYMDNETQTPVPFTFICVQ